MRRRATLLLLGALLLGTAASPPPPKPGLPALQRPMADLPRVATWPIGKFADWVAITPDAVWVAGKEPESVHRIDPATNADTATIALPGDACAGLAAGFGSLWVPLCKDGASSVLRIDQASGALLATVPMGPPAEGGIAVGSAAVWFTSGGDTLIGLDPKTNAPRHKVTIASGSQVPVVDRDTVWVTSLDHDIVTAVDARTGHVLGTVPTGPRPRFLTAGAGAIWTLNQGDGTVTRIDALTRKVVATIPLGVPGNGGDIAYGDGLVWVTSLGVPLTAVDVRTNKPLVQWTGPGGDSLRFGHGAIWLTDLRRGGVDRIDPAAARVGPKE